MSVRDTFGWRPFRAVRGHASAALAPPPAASVQRSCHARSLNEHGCRRVLSGGTVRDAPVIEGVQPGHAQRDDSRHWSHVDSIASISQTGARVRKTPIASVRASDGRDRNGSFFFFLCTPTAPNRRGWQRRTWSFNGGRTALTRFICASIGCCIRPFHRLHGGMSPAFLCVV